VDITPEQPGVYLAGYGTRKSTGTHDNIYASCLVLDDGKTAVAFVTMDLIGLFKNDIDLMRKRAAEKSGLKKENIFVASIHTHSAPDTMGLWGGVERKYMNRLVEAVAKSVVMANKLKKKASITFASTQLSGYTINRRHPIEGKVEEGLLVAQVNDLDGNTIGTLVNFSCHPVVLGGDNLLITADFPAYVRDFISEKGGGVTLYVSRVIGDVNPLPIHPEDVKIKGKVYERGGGTFPMAQDLGEAIAEKALTALKDGEEIRELRIVVRKKELEIPLDNRLFITGYKELVLKQEVEKEPEEEIEEEIPEKKALIEIPSNETITTAFRESIVDEGDGYYSMPTEINLIKLGPAEILTLPGELVSLLGFEFLEEMDAKYKFIFGLCQHEISYIIPEEEYHTGGYEESMCISIEAGEMIREAVPELLIEGN